MGVIGAVGPKGHTPPQRNPFPMTAHKVRGGFLLDSAATPA